jgi:hypothetical protein
MGHDRCRPLVPAVGRADDHEMTSRGRRVLVVVIAVVLVLGAASYGVWRTQRQVPVVVDAACPALLTNTRNSTDDYGDTVEWAGQTWWRSEARTTGDLEQVGVVTCSVSAMPNEHGWRVAQGRWPDGVATVLPRGTTLHLPREDRAEQGLVARTADGDHLYCLDDEPAGPLSC